MNKEALAYCQDLAISLCQILLRAILLSLILAYVFSFVGYLKAFGRADLILPFAAANTSTAAVSALGHQLGDGGAFPYFLNWYNESFPGDSRLGSGIGLIFGAFWGLFHIRNDHGSVRLLCGLSSGAIAGGRLGLMLSSTQSFFVGGLVILALIVGFHMYVNAGKRRLPRLPLCSHNVSETELPLA